MTSVWLAWEKLKGTGKPKVLGVCRPQRRGQAGKDPVCVTWMQVRADLLAAGTDRNKTDQQPNSPLLKLWRHLRLEQRFTKREMRPQRGIWAVQLEDYIAPKDILSDAVFHYG